MSEVDKDTKIKCTLCGAVFEPDENTCGGCIVRKDCKLVCCPNCGFGIPRESKLATWFKQRLEKQRSR
jgi:hypothetical protein